MQVLRARSAAQPADRPLLSYSQGEAASVGDVRPGRLVDPPDQLFLSGRDHPGVGTRDRLSPQKPGPTDMAHPAHHRGDRSRPQSPHGYLLANLVPALRRAAGVQLGSGLFPLSPALRPDDQSLFFPVSALDPCIDPGGETGANAAASRRRAARLLVHRLSIAAHRLLADLRLPVHALCGRDGPISVLFGIDLHTAHHFGQVLSARPSVDSLDPHELGRRPFHVSRKGPRPGRAVDQSGDQRPVPRAGRGRHQLRARRDRDHPARGVRRSASKLCQEPRASTPRAGRSPLGGPGPGGETVRCRQDQL